MRDLLVEKYLVYDPRNLGLDNDSDTILESFGPKGREFSNCNQKNLLDEFNKIKENCKVIVEIGVARLSTNKYDNTSTVVLLNNKNSDTKYLGIDIEDRSFIESKGNNIHTLLAKSEDYNKVEKKLSDLNINQIDFLFIDGWHSINQVIDELYYIKYMKPGGVVGFHDTNEHPGPLKVIESMRPDLFEIKKYCTTGDDYGISFAILK